MGLFEATLEATIAAGEKAREAEADGQGYIGPDGLLMCGRCGERRQMVLDIPLIGTKTVPVMCRCEAARREAEQRRLQFIEEQTRIQEMRRIGITSSDYAEMTFAADDGSNPELSNLARQYVEKRAEMIRENMGLLLHGSTGGGKTFLAASIVNAMIDNGTSAMITTIPQLITAMQRDFERDKPRLLEQIARVRVLVLDDIGFERQTGYTAEKVFEIVDTRYRARRPLIVTTNLSLEELTSPEQMEYKRVYERIIEMTQPVYVSAEGRRMAIAKKKSVRFREIMGM